MDLEKEGPDGQEGKDCETKFEIHGKKERANILTRLNLFIEKNRVSRGACYPSDTLDHPEHFVVKGRPLVRLSPRGPRIGVLTRPNGGGVA
jgi:hypothetical protein